MASTLHTKRGIGTLRARWNSLAAPACPAGRKAALTRTFQISAWVTLFAGVPPVVVMALLGDHRRARIVIVQELCLLAALWLNRLQKLECAARVAAIGILASATWMVAGSPDGFHDFGLLICPGALIVAALWAGRRFRIAFAALALVIAAGLAAPRANAVPLWCALAILAAIAAGAGLLTRAAWNCMAASQAASRRLRFQVDRMPLAYIAWDREFLVTEWNHAAERIFGWSAAEAVGRHVYFIVSPDMRPLVDAVGAKALSGDENSHSLNENVAKDGKRLFCEWFNTPVRDDSGQVTEVLSMVHDVTEQRNLEAANMQSEEQLRQVWERSRDGMRLSGADGRVLRVNFAYCQLVNKSREELEGGLFTVMHAAPLQASRLETYCRRVRDRAIDSRMERPIELWDGRTIWMAVSNSIIESPQAPLVLSIFRDVTARKLDEARLNEALLKAEAANRAKSEFLANMSHEIRTPMNGVLGMTALALEGPLETEQRQYLEMARASAQSLLGLLNDILDLSKIEAGRLDIASVDFSPRQVIGDLLDSVGLAARQKGIRLHAHIAPQVPAMVNGDPMRLRQVLMNLLGNALKFTERGSVTVELDCSGAEQRLHQLQGRPAANALRLSGAVIDSGIGVPADKHNLIFDAFAQADGSTTRRFGGTGLGLSICKRLLQLMNGTISVESVPGQGSAFRFTLEVRPAASIAALTPRPQAALDQLRSARPLKILLAEDNQVNQLIVVRMLEKSGHSVSVAVNGREVLRLLGEDRYDAVLMDVQMPEMDGLEATRRIRQSESASGANGRIPVIALTAHAMAGDEQSCFDAGMDGYLSKPLDAKTLADTLLRI